MAQPLRMTVATEIQHNVTIMRDERNGLLMPWLTRPCLEWLDRQAFDEVFEWGVGYGRYWWRARAKHIGVDHDSKWADALVSLHDNMLSYVNAIDGVSPQDIVVIDGQWRNECAAKLISLPWRPRFVIFDNSNWIEFEPAMKALKHAKFAHVAEFWDKGHDGWLTTVFGMEQIR